MLLHIRSLTGREHFTAKFIRVGNEVYIIGEEDNLTYHKELAQKHNILERIEHFKNQDPEMVDGGMVFVSGPVIRIGAASTSLSIPTVDRARKQTILKLRREYPAFSVKEVSDE